MILILSDTSLELLRSSSDFVIGTNSRLGFYDYMSNITEEASTKAVHTKILLILTVESVVQYGGDNYRSQDVSHVASLYLHILDKLKAHHCNSSILVALPWNLFPCHQGPYLSPDCTSLSKIQYHLLMHRLHEVFASNSYAALIDFSDIFCLSSTEQFKLYCRSSSFLYYKNLTPFLSRVHSSFRLLSHPSIKLIALDLDNTLWNGTLREDGTSGLQIGGLSSIGQCFYLFQKFFKSLRDSGMLLALVTKNIHEDVFRSFQDHPDMPLSLDDFIIVKASDQPKSLSLLQISQELNLTLESFLFIDDSPFERLEVADNTPQVSVFDMPINPFERLDSFFASNFPSLLQFSPESEQDRTVLYRARALRLQDKDSHSKAGTNYKEWLSTLDQSLIVTQLENTNPRVQELFFRTNQFNLSKTFLPSDFNPFGYALFQYELTDKYGSDGIIAASLLQLNPNHMHLVNLVLSCRVFNRHVENAIASHLLTFSLEKLSSLALSVNLVPSPTNRAATEFFENALDQSGFLIPDAISFDSNLMQIKYAK